MQTRTKLAFAGVALALAAGCSSDAVTQLSMNPAYRTEVMNAIASRRELAEAMTRRLLATDSLRAGVVETMLRDDGAAQYLLRRIYTNTGAVDLVLAGALRDSAEREHVFTLVKGMQMAMEARKR
ncbi:MAG TPA: hypothetical protein VGU27_08905 [Candidatus Eisenbacteria bacterium]|nr:hypothetical protein [Candidatus Eisenbacteria bacterium]